MDEGTAYAGIALALLVLAGGGRRRVTSDEEVALRVLSSEVAGESDTIKRAVLWCIRNLARDEGRSLFVSATRGFGFGDIGEAGRPRPYSTRFSPSAAERNLDGPLVRGVLAAGQGADPTGGANDWFQPAEQDAFHAQGLPGYTRTSAQVIADALRDGAEDLGDVGSGNGRLHLFRKRI